MAFVFSIYQTAFMFCIYQTAFMFCMSDGIYHQFRTRWCYLKVIFSESFIHLIRVAMIEFIGLLDMGCYL